MGEVVFTIFLFFGIIAVTVVLFGGWVIVSIVRFIFRTVFGISAGPAMPVPRQMRCPRRRCDALNPVSARFCRRCGHELPAGNELAYRRAAIL